MTDVRRERAPSRAEILALDRRHVWRPYTGSDEHERHDPLVVVEAEGAWLVDADGRRYLDGNASWWTASLGHRHPRLVSVLRAQSERLLHCSMASTTHAEGALLARDLAATAPRGLERVFFSDDGSTAVEAALKIAVQHWRQVGRPSRRLFAVLSGAFHGDTLGAVSVGGVEAFRHAFEPLLFEVFRAPEPGEGEGGWERVVASIEALLRARPDEVAGVLVEPMIQGAAGMRLWPAAHLLRLREATARADTFLVADEVFTGLGRTGPMWACAHAGVAPDLLCAAKALSGGALPFAATLATERVYAAFRGDKSRALLHGHTFCGNPLGAALAREVLAIYRDEDVLARAAPKAGRLAEGFARIGRLAGVARARALGMVGAADLGAGGYLGGAGFRVYEAARRRGAYVRPLGDTVYLCPPLTIGDDELEKLLDILHDSVAEVAGER